MNKLANLENRLHYEFKQPAYLKQALTHRSISSDNNERLEFLGDSIVNCVIAEALYIKFPAAKEGQLSRLRAHLVCGKTLAELARQLQVGEYVLLGPGELKSGGYLRTSILADTLEAVFAAVYLDSDMQTCRDVILQIYQQRLQQATLQQDCKDPKTLLQEHLQARKLPLPAYTVATVDGEAHAQIFVVNCEVPGLALVGRGTGSSRRRAEQQAAEYCLQEMKKLAYEE